MSQQWNKFYHWRSHGCTPWAKTYFESALVGVAVPAPGGGEVSTTGVTAFDGDVELGNRKGKLITIYDTSVTLSWADSAGTTRGTLTFPEVSHEVADDDGEYIWQSALTTSDDKDNSPKVYDAVRKQLVPKLLPKLHAFRDELIAAHAAILGHDAPDGAAPQAAATPAATATPGAGTPAPATGAQSAAGPAKKATSVSSKTLTQSANLMISPTDLWDLLTNPQKIPMWTKAPAQVNLAPGGAFSLFGGNVTGHTIAASVPTELTQSWRLSTWPAGHYGELTTRLEEGAGSTALTLALTGVPVGDEDATEQGLDAYYLRSLKAMGLGTIL